MNATVTLPISELDSLRDSLREAQAKVEHYKKHEASVKIEIKERSWGHEFGGQAHYRTEYDGWGRGRIVPDEKIIESVKYLGLDEVSSIIRQEIEKKHLEKMDSLQREINRHSKEVRDLKESHREDVAKLHETYKKEIATIRGEIEDKTKDKRIEELSHMVSELQRERDYQKNRVEEIEARSLLKRLFS